MNFYLLEKGKGPSKKWKKLIELPDLSVSSLLITKLAYPFKYEHIIEENPIGEQLFVEFCANSNPNYLLCWNLLNDCKKFNLYVEKSESEKNKYFDKFWNDYFHKFSAIDGLEGTSEEYLDKGAELSLATRFEFYARKIRSFLKQKPFFEFLQSLYFYRFLQWKSIEKDLPNLRLYRNYFSNRSTSEFGEYYTKQCKITGTFYTTEAIDIRYLGSRKTRALLNNEIDLLQSLNNRFIISLAFAKATLSFVYLIYSSVRCGDLKFQIYAAKPEPGLLLKRAQFYAAEIVCGLDYLHRNNIIHLNLTPENILLDEFGHLKIAGLKLSWKINSEDTISNDQLPIGYTAPEILQNKTYGFASDWFSFGCILYEMIAGEHPFMHFNEKVEKNEIDRRVCENFEYYGPTFILDAKYLCRKLLAKTSYNRIGGQDCSGNLTILRKYPFFKNIKWNHFENGLVDPEYIPKYGVKRKCKKTGFTIDRSIHPYRILALEFQRRIVPRVWQSEMIKSNCFRVLNAFENQTESTSDKQFELEKLKKCIDKMSKTKSGNFYY